MRFCPRLEKGSGGRPGAALRRHAPRLHGEMRLELRILLPALLLSLAILSLAGASGLLSALPRPRPESLPPQSAAEAAPAPPAPPPEAAQLGARLEQWAAAAGGAIRGVALSAGPPRGVVANGALAKGDVVLRLPRSALVTEEVAEAAPAAAAVAALAEGWAREPLDWQEDVRIVMMIMIMINMTMIVHKFERMIITSLS